MSLRSILANKRSGAVLAAALGVAWVLALVAADRALLGYDYQQGVDAKPPVSWPQGTKAQRANGLPTIVVLAHPKCPCTRATIEELAMLMAKVNGRATADVIFVRPEGMPADWEKTDLWRSAARIPGVNVLSDVDGSETKFFGAEASGQTFYYDKNGTLEFSGGITESRGHSGDNDGRSAITSLVLTGHASTNHTSVYGCSLKNPERAKN